MNPAVPVESPRSAFCSADSPKARPNLERQPCVDISVGSRFHAFDLARELDNRNMIRSLYTGYPAFSAGRFGLRRSLIRSVPTTEMLNRLAGSLHRIGRSRTAWDPVICNHFDRIVATRLQPGANIFVGWSSQCRRTLRRASDLGMITIVERGSTHILWQRDILLEEASLAGVKPEIPHPEIVAAELEEYAAADHIAVPTQFTAQTFVARGIPVHRLLINPYGVDLSRFAPGQRSPADVLRVLHVGRVSVRKGVHYLAPAVRQVSGATLTLVGSVDPGMEKALAGRNTRLVGAVSGKLLPRFYNEADVFCLLSIEEGMALVIAQAMAMGLPVIATPNSGAAELINDGVEGFLVPPRDVDAVAEKLRLLANDISLRREMGRRAREKVQSGYGWTDYGARAAANYSEILRSAKNRR
jgi:glycosyltransferase involved in cell wall biosynthesis